MKIVTGTEPVPQAYVGTRQGHISRWDYTAGGWRTTGLDIGMPERAKAMSEEVDDGVIVWEAASSPEERIFFFKGQVVTTADLNRWANVGEDDSFESVAEMTLGLRPERKE